MAIEALDIVEKFERAQIITGGRLNGRTYAYKCGLEDGKRKALEQEPKIGYWIMTNDYFTGAYETIGYVKCSCCGEDSLEEGNFCPSCGAKMVEP